MLPETIPQNEMTDLAHLPSKASVSYFLCSWTEDLMSWEGQEKTDRMTELQVQDGVSYLPGSVLARAGQESQDRVVRKWKWD